VEASNPPRIRRPLLASFLQVPVIRFFLRAPWTGMLVHKEHLNACA
jgi:hypothetical protein